jgi:hypothetical protein
MEYLKTGNLKEWEAEAKRLNGLLHLPEVKANWSYRDYAKLQSKFDAAKEAVYCLLPQIEVA